MQNHRSLCIFLFIAITVFTFTNTVLADEDDETVPAEVFSFDDESDNIMMIAGNGQGSVEDVISFPIDYAQITGGYGIKGNALYMDGSFGLLLSPDMNTSSYTISFWIKPDAITANTPALSLFKNSLGDDGYYTSVLLDHDWFQPNIYNYSNTSGEQYSSSFGIAGQLTPDVWTNIVIIADGTIEVNDYCNKFYLYIDGEYSCSGEILKSFCDDNTSYWFGMNLSDEMYKGYVDEIVFYDKALFPSQIKALFKTYSGNSSDPDMTGNTNTDPSSEITSPDNQPNNRLNDSLEGIIEIDQGTLPDSDSSSLNNTLNPVIAAGVEYKTDAYADAALLLSILLFALSICFFLTYRKKKRNHY